MTNLKRRMQHKRLQRLCTKIVNDAVNNTGVGAYCVITEYSLRTLDADCSWPMSRESSVCCDGVNRVATRP